MHLKANLSILSASDAVQLNCIRLKYAVRSLYGWRKLQVLAEAKKAMASRIIIAGHQDFSTSWFCRSENNEGRSCLQTAMSSRVIRRNCYLA
jgi:hypothetical protein